MQIVYYNEYRLCMFLMCAKEHDVYVDIMTTPKYHQQSEYSDFS